MAGKSKWLEMQVLNHTLRGTVYTPPTSLYIALFTTDPTDAGTGTEVSGAGYARQLITFSAASTSGVTTSSNAADIFYPVATAAWGTVTHFGIFDAATAGHLLYSGQITPNQPVVASNQLKIDAGTLIITED
ncbi:hypothetical protein [Paenibacillus sp. Marseille-Q4541]|uniref:phage tail fiber protein n=1 Tax=Paenibacillus sp. Marseille-Q4541 TaxID=2831522 RepID=UPI001BAD939F|nr:hypothetical protein [Paenibacillus sp. Marseille-Q4541]